MFRYIPVEHDPFGHAYEIEKLVLTNEPQREIWLACMIGGEDANLSYNESVSLKIVGNLNVDAFRRAVSDVVLRHEALRATISPNGETLIIYGNVPISVTLEDISGLGNEMSISAFQSFLKKEMNTPLSLTDGPLFKAWLHKTGEQEFCFTIIKHHIISDGWSTGIMLEDLSSFYNAYAKGERITLEPAAQLSDYAAAQTAFKQTRENRETEDFWLNQYRDDVPVVDIPTDLPRTAPRTYKGHRIDHPVSKDFAAQIKAVGAKHGCSLVTTLLAAFEVWLYQVARQTDLVVGLPSSGQAATGLNNVVGHCVNLLPLRTRIDPAQPFTDYLKKRRKEVLDAYDHQRITFGELIKKLYIPRDPSRIPLVPVMFNIDMGMDNAVRFDGLSFKLISNPRDYENFEIYLNATGSKEGILLEWSYNTGLFDAATIRTFSRQYQDILQKIVTDAHQPIREIVEVSSRVAIARGAELLIAPEVNLLSLFDAAVGKYPDKTAVTYNNVSLTYRQLRDKSVSLAAHLKEFGIAKGDIVAISLDRSLEMMVALLGVLYAGAAYLPLDPEYPQERTGFMLDDSGAKLLITSKAFGIRYERTSSKLIIESIWAELGKKVADTPLTIGPSDLSYALYTSGSTGKPKGVQITHRNLTNFLLSMKERPGITDQDTLLAITSISFDIAGLELYLPLIAGATVVIADRDAIMDGRILLSIVNNRGISMMQATPSTWQMLLDAGWERKYPVKMLSGGEALPADLAEKLLERGSELWNMYGPTETTVWSTVKKVMPADRQFTIGTPIFNTVVCMLDEQGKLLPAGNAGEICIGGDGVAAGYLNRSELTAERFISSAELPGTRLYRTGDLGKLLPNGELVYMGRLDHQVKIRGHRIELGEIEAAVSAIPGIKQAVVLAREDNQTDKRLVAYVTQNLEPTAGNVGWKDRWDTLYETGAESKQKAGNNTAGIDGTLLESLENKEELARQHAEWLQTTVDRIKELKATGIYEIGCGAGQVMFELAAGVKNYVATDYAQAAITNINERLAASPGQWKHIKTGVAPADDFSVLGDTPVDLIVINSVAQYFPGTDYFINVIRQAIHTLKNGGCLFIGDMQGMASLEMHHAMDYYPRAAGETTIRQFRDVVANRVRIEEEFVADPAFFYLLPAIVPGITGVDVQLRRGHALNETTKYHYDVWLYTGIPVTTVAPQAVREWNDIRGIGQLENFLGENSNRVTAIRQIPNSRTVKDYALLHILTSEASGATLNDIKTQIDRAEGGIHPDTLWELADRLGIKANIRWTTDGTDGTFDAIFMPPTQQVQAPAFDMPGKSIYDYARTPLANTELHLPAELIQKWRTELQQVLPAYMVPDDFVGLSKFPLTPNAKVDRKALPRPQMRQQTEARTSAPLTPNEQLVLDIWRDILGLHDIGVNEDFFQLGGHSLLAVKVMVAIEKKTGKRLPIATLFTNSTISRLAGQLTDNAAPPQWDALVAIRTEGTKAPLFLVHGGGLNVLLFRSLVEFFDKDQPIYGIQALGLSHETEIPETIEGIAARYVADVVKAHPDGPYALAGYSLGGFIAFEMGRQLKAMGRDVSFLGIMDTYAGNNTYVGDGAARAMKKIARQFQKVPFFTRQFINNPMEAIEYQKTILQKKLHKMAHEDEVIVEDPFNDYETNIYSRYSHALDAFVLQPLDIRITLFRVQKRLYFLDDLVYLGWDKFAGRGVTVREVPGDHKTFLFPPNTKRLAEVIQEELDSL